MVNICMVAYTYYERDPRVRRDAEALIEAGYAVDVIALRDNAQPSKEKISGVQIYRVPMRKLRGGKLSYIFAFLAFFIFASCYVSFLDLRNHYGLIHVHNMPNFLVFSAFLPKIMGVPVILDIHDPMPELFGSIFTGKANLLFRSILLFEEKISFRFADQLITVHKGMFDLLTKRGVDPARLEIIHNLPDPAIFGKPKVTKPNQNYFTLVYAGTVSPRHRLDLVIQALCNLKDEMPDLRFIIIGDGPDIPRLKSLAKENQIEEKVDFQGVVSMVKVPALLGQGDAALASYSDDDFGNLVFPTKAVEAIMIGLPVLCTRVKAVLDYLDDDTLFYFTPDDLDTLIHQIRLIRQNPELVKTKLKNGQNFLALFNWDQEKRKLIHIYNLWISGDK
jgi:glycosyltransferase involved in cell wall biosynthesis